MPRDHEAERSYIGSDGMPVWKHTKRNAMTEAAEAATAELELHGMDRKWADVYRARAARGPVPGTPPRESIEPDFGPKETIKDIDERHKIVTSDVDCSALASCAACINQSPPDGVDNGQRCVW